MRKNCDKSDAPNDYCGNPGCHVRKPFAPSTRRDCRLPCTSSSNGSRVGPSWNKPAMSLPWASPASAKAMPWLPLVMNWSCRVMPCSAPEHGMTLHDQFMTNGSQGMAFADAGLAHGNDIAGLFQEGPTLEPFELEVQGRRQSRRVEGAKGFLT